MLRRFTKAAILATAWMLASLSAGAISTPADTATDILEQSEPVPTEAQAGMDPTTTPQTAAAPTAATVIEAPMPAAEAPPTAAGPDETISRGEPADTSAVKRSRQFEQMRNYFADNYEEIMAKVEERYARRKEALESMHKGFEDDFNNSDKRYEELRKEAMKEMDNAIRRYDELRKLAIEEQEARIRRYEAMQREAVEEREDWQRRYEEFHKSIDEQLAELEKDRKAMHGMSTDERRAYIEDHMNEMMEKRAEMMEQRAAMMEQRTGLAQMQPATRVAPRAQ